MDEEVTCTRPCSKCGQPFECWFVAEACTEEYHPCKTCDDVVYAPKPWPKGFRIGEVLYEGRLLGKIPIPPTDDSKDPNGTMGHIGRVVLADLLSKNVIPPDMKPQEWILWVLRGIGIAMLGHRDEAFEQHIMSRYLRHCGAIGGMAMLIRLATRRQGQAPSS